MADKYIRNLLHKWNMSCLISTFQGKGIDTVAFNSLDYPTISGLIPHKDIRKMFKNKYNQYKIHTCSDEVDQTDLSDIQNPIIEEIDLNDEPKEEYEQLKSELQSSSFDIEFILSESPFGKQVIDTYNSIGHLDYAASMCLSNILVDFLISQSDDYSIDNDVLDEIADAIIYKFPNEKKDAYYDFSGKNPRGNLIECYYNVRTKLIKEDKLKKKLNSTPDLSRRDVGKKQKSQPNSQRETEAVMPEWVDVEGVTNEEMVNLKWDSHRNGLLHNLPNLLENEKFVDMTIMCEGQSVKCHQIVLSSYSIHFDNMLSASPCKHPVIFLGDVQFWEIRALVDFMYKGELNIEESKLPKLFEAATKLNVKGLANIDIQDDGDDVGSIDNEDSNPGDRVDPLSTTPSGSNRKRQNTSSLEKILGPLLTNDKLLMSKKNKLCQNTASSEVVKESKYERSLLCTNLNSRKISQNPNDGKHRLDSIPGKLWRICNECRLRGKQCFARYCCTTCDVGLHQRCYYNGHKTRPVTKSVPVTKEMFIKI